MWVQFFPSISVMSSKVHHPVHNNTILSRPHCISILKLSSHLRLSHLIGLFFTDTQTKYICTFLMPVTCSVHLILLDFISPIELVNSTNYEVPQDVIISILLLLLVSYIHIFSSVPCFEAPSICVLPLGRQIKCHTNIKQRAILHIHDLFW
jgi:hypothetical protein